MPKSYIPIVLSTSLSAVLADRLTRMVAGTLLLSFLVITSMLPVTATRQSPATDDQGLPSGVQSEGLREARQRQAREHRAARVAGDLDGVIALLYEHNDETASENAEPDQEASSSAPKQKTTQTLNVMSDLLGLITVLAGNKGDALSASPLTQQSTMYRFVKLCMERRYGHLLGAMIHQMRMHGALHSTVKLFDKPGRDGKFPLRVQLEKDIQEAMKKNHNGQKAKSVHEVVSVIHTVVKCLLKYEGGYHLGAFCDFIGWVRNTTAGREWGGGDRPKHITSSVLTTATIDRRMASKDVLEVADSIQ